MNDFITLDLVWGLLMHLGCVVRANWGAA